MSSVGNLRGQITQEAGVHTAMAVTRLLQQVGQQTQTLNTVFIRGGSGGTTLNATGVTAGSYTFTDLTVGSDGRLTSASSNTIASLGLVTGTGTTGTIPYWSNGPGGVLGNSSAQSDGTYFAAYGSAGGLETGATIGIAAGIDGFQGGNAVLIGGTGNAGSAFGGDASVTGGAGPAAGGSGGVYGGSSSAGVGGPIYAYAGDGVTGATVFIRAGNAVSGNNNGGNVDLLSGSLSGSGVAGAFRFKNRSATFYGILDFSAATANRTYAYPDATGTLPLLSLAQTWTAVNTYSAQDVHNAGVSLGTSGVLASAVANGAAAMSILMQPTVAQTSGTDRWTHVMKDSAGNVRFSIASNGGVSLFSEGATNNALVSVAGTAPSSMGYGIFFTPTLVGAGGIISNHSANVNVGGYFAASDNSASTATDLVGGFFGNASVYGARAHTSIVGALLAPVSNWNSSGVFAHGSIYGFKILPVTTVMSGTATAIYGGYIPPMLSNITPTTTDAYGLWIGAQAQATNKYGLWLDGTTAGYKAISIGSTSNFIAPESSTTFSLNATTVIVKADLDVSAKNIITDATGTKIATATTQKLGFWNVAPVVQPAAALQAALTNSTGGAQDGTLVDVGVVFSQAAINNNFTDVYALLDAMRTALVNSGIMKGAA